MPPIAYPQDINFAGGKVEQGREKKLNPYKPGIPFLGHRQTLQTQIRRHRTPAVSDQGLYCLLTGIAIKNMIKLKKLH